MKRWGTRLHAAANRYLDRVAGKAGRTLPVVMLTVRADHQSV